MPRLPFIPSAYGQGRSVSFESQRFINLYPELATAPGAKGIAMLVGTPGRRIWFANGSPPTRGLIAFNGLLYVVISNKLISVASDGVTTTVLGQLLTSTGRVSMKNNGLAAAGIGGDQICIVDGTAGYIYNVVTGVFQQIVSIPAIQAVASLTTASASIQSITVTNRGSGYAQATPPTATVTGAPGVGAVLKVNLGYSFTGVSWTGTVKARSTIVTITDITGIGATAHAVLTGGVITSIVMDSLGHGYTNPTITVSGVAAGTLVPVLNLTGGGEVISVDVTNGGSGYVAPVVTFSSGTAAASATAVNSTITAINVVSGGSGYATLPQVNVVGTGGVTVARATVVNTTITAITVTAGGTGYTGVPTVTVSAPEGTTFIDNPRQLEYMDGYFVVSDGSMSSYTSNLNNGTIWNALTKNPVQAAPDFIQAMINSHQQLFFIKQYTSEVYYNTGTPTSSGSPFSRLPGAVIDYGTMAPWSVARGGNSVFFLANQRDGDTGSFAGVAMLVGYTPTIISPPSITYRMSLSTDLSQCFGYCYNDEGHVFYVLTNPVDNWTFVYDATTQMWHERSSSDLSNADISRDMGNCYVFFSGMHIVGSQFTGNLYEMSSKFYTDAGLPIVAEQTTQRLADEDYLDDIFIGELKVDVEAGVGIDGVNSPATAVTTILGGAVTACTVTYNGADYTVAPTVILRSTDGVGIGATAIAEVVSGSVKKITVTNGGSGYQREPEVILAMPEVIPSAGLSISKDGGHTWSSEYPKSMGKAGEFRKRLRWSGVGRSKDRVFRLRISSPVKKIILGYYVEPS